MTLSVIKNGLGTEQVNEQGTANKMLVVDAGPMKDLMSQQMKNMKYKTARLMQLRRKLKAEET